LQTPLAKVFLTQDLTPFHRLIFWPTSGLSKDGSVFIDNLIFSSPPGLFFALFRLDLTDFEYEAFALAGIEWIKVRRDKATLRRVWAALESK
jgi:hypothetical protein